jgi:hypothetical protein
VGLLVVGSYGRKGEKSFDMLVRESAIPVPWL